MSTATPCPPGVSGRTNAEILCEPLTDPAGFIYPAYRAADTPAHSDACSLETSQTPYCGRPYPESSGTFRRYTQSLHRLEPALLFLGSLGFEDPAPKP